MTNRKYLQAALQGVESESIRAWASTPHNTAILLKIAKGFINHGEPVEKLTTFIVAKAIGLWD